MNVASIAKFCAFLQELTLKFGMDGIHCASMMLSYSIRSGSYIINLCSCGTTSLNGKSPVAGKKNNEAKRRE